MGGDVLGVRFMDGEFYRLLVGCQVGEIGEISTAAAALAAGVGAGERAPSRSAQRWSIRSSCTRI